MNWNVLVTCFAATLAVAHGQSYYCSNKANCTADECCLATSIGRLQTEGICTIRVRLGYLCSEDGREVAAYGNKAVWVCPCAEGLKCEYDRSRPIPRDEATRLAGLRCVRDVPAFNEVEVDEGFAPLRLGNRGEPARDD